MDSVPITVRNVDPELQRRLHTIRVKRGESRNATVRHGLRAGKGPDTGCGRRNRYAGRRTCDPDKLTTPPRAPRSIDARQ